MGTELGGKSVSLVAQLSNSLTSLASKAANIREEAVKTVESLTGYPIAIPLSFPLGSHHLGCFLTWSTP
jgi:hypothetical protein